MGRLLWFARCKQALNLFRGARGIRQVYKLLIIDWKAAKWICRFLKGTVMLTLTTALDHDRDPGLPQEISATLTIRGG